MSRFSSKAVIIITKGETPQNCSSWLRESARSLFALSSRVHYYYNSRSSRPFPFTQPIQSFSKAAAALPFFSPSSFRPVVSHFGSPSPPPSSCSHISSSHLHFPVQIFLPSSSSTMILSTRDSNLQSFPRLCDSPVPSVGILGVPRQSLHHTIMRISIQFIMFSWDKLSMFAAVSRFAFGAHSVSWGALMAWVISALVLTVL